MVITLCNDDDDILYKIRNKLTAGITFEGKEIEGFLTPHFVGSRLVVAQEESHC